MALLPASFLPACTEKSDQVLQRQTGDSRNPFQTPPYGKIREYFKANPMHDEGMRLLSKGTGFYLRQWVTTQIRKYCYAKAAGTLNYSTAAYDILPSYGVKKEQIHVTYNSTDTDALLKEKESVLASPSILPPCDRRLLHIGRLVKWKRVDLLIEAFRKVAADYPEAELVIVGDGPEPGPPQATGKRLAIGRPYPLYRSRLRSEDAGSLYERIEYLCAGGYGRTFDQ